ncbi:RICIN domain-containing protein [Nocardia fluminea]
MSDLKSGPGYQAPVEQPPGIGSVPDVRLGEASDGFAQVQQFLRQFGYLTADPAVPPGEDDAAREKMTGVLDADTSAALARYQSVHGLSVTGLFDSDTRAMMLQPRCLLPDPEPGIAPRSSVVSCRWGKSDFSYAFDAGTADIPGDNERQAVRAAFITWSAAAPIAFREVATSASPDLLIRWGNSNCGDTNMTATSTGDVLAHCDYPPRCGVYGQALPRPLHFDDQEHTWVVGLGAACFDVETVALHEIGHFLGLQHSVAGTVMQPNTAADSIRRVLTADDIEGVRRLFPPTGPLFVKHSGKCLDIKDVSMASGADATQWDYWGGGNQLFKFEWVETGYYTIVVTHSNKVLDVAGGSTAAGARVQQWDRANGNNQRFRLDPAGHGYYRIAAKHSNRVLDVFGASPDPGTKVIQFDEKASDNQLWRLGHAPITAVHSGKVIDATAFGLFAGSPLIQSHYWGSVSHKLRLDPVGDGYYRIMIEQTGMCVDVTGISTAAGAVIQQWPYWGGDNQKWRLDAVGNGHVKIIAKHSGLCIDVQDGSTEAGARLIQFPYHGGNNQRWRL